MKINFKKIAAIVLSVVLLTCVMSISVFAAETTGPAETTASSGNVAGAVEDTWKEARGQIKDVVNNVIFPVIDLILAVLFFVKIATAYLDYRKHGQFEWTAPAILLGTLVFSLTCPLYIWNILGI